MDQSFSYYIDRYTTGNISAEELKEFARLLKEPSNQAILHQLMDDSWALWQDHQMDFPEVTERVEIALQERIAAKGIEAVISTDIGSAQRVHFLRRWGWAAAVILVAGITIAIALSSDRQSDKKESAISTIIQPGGDKAVLTLADGSKIILDSTATGSLAQQGNADIVKLNNGQIAYNLKGIPGKEVLMNTMSTPNGGQYQLTLPDGSNVWLNAASSIQFPAAFTGATRTVRISGEVYFEIAQDKEKPFIVNVDGLSSVQVLGTRFNVNSYADEDNIKATLIEGSVRVAKIPDQVRNDRKNPDDNSQYDQGGRILNEKSGVVLKPGQQAVLRIPGQNGNDATNGNSRNNDAESISVQSADIDQILAWKNGLFNFNGLALPVVMRQLERWYDIKVRYENNAPDLIFRGKMYRNSNLADALEILQKLGVKCRLEGKTLIVL